jgi:hypothetical protein
MTQPNAHDELRRQLAGLIAAAALLYGRDAEITRLLKAAAKEAR